jgi:hypothetical protein
VKRIEYFNLVVFTATFYEYNLPVYYNSTSLSYMVPLATRVGSVRDPYSGFNFTKERETGRRLALKEFFILVGQRSHKKGSS